MKPYRSVLISGILLAQIGVSQGATTLSSNLTADDTFNAYLSTNDNVLGTFIAEGSPWFAPHSFSGAALVPGVTNYLHVVVDNTFGGQNMFIGQFSLSDSGFQFANGTQSLLTNTTSNWRTSAGGSASLWAAPSGTPVSFGSNGCCVWDTSAGTASIDPSAQFIWYVLADNTVGAFFSTTITPSAASVVPLPATLPLMGTLLGAGYLVSRWRTRRAARD